MDDLADAIVKLLSKHKIQDYVFAFTGKTGGRCGMHGSAENIQALLESLKEHLDEEAASSLELN